MRKQSKPNLARIMMQTENRVYSLHVKHNLFNFNQSGLIYRPNQWRRSDLYGQSRKNIDLCSGKDTRRNEMKRERERERERERSKLHWAGLSNATVCK